MIMTYHDYQFDKNVSESILICTKKPVEESLWKPANTFVIKYIWVTGSSWKLEVKNDWSVIITMTLNGLRYFINKQLY